MIKKVNYLVGNDAISLFLSTLLKGSTNLNDPKQHYDADSYRFLFLLRAQKNIEDVNTRLCEALVE